MSDSKVTYQLLFRSKQAMVSDRPITEFVGHVELPRGQARHGTVTSMMPCADGAGNNLREFYEMGEKIPSSLFFGRAVPENWDADNILEHVNFRLETMGDSARAIMMASDLPATAPDRESYLIVGQMASKNMRIATGSVQVFEGKGGPDDGVRYTGTVGRELNTGWDVPSPIMLANSTMARVISTPIWGNHDDPFTLGPYFSPKITRALREAADHVARGYEVHEIPEAVTHHLPENFKALFSDCDYADHLRAVRDHDEQLLKVPFGPSSRADLERYDEAVELHRSQQMAMPA
ncbi:hypothetical protein [Sulfitobacter sp. R18_1]|uniref:hypothetical protein n=1 Tax=Sulfitobacter sp. R18_1 TaxID=2821104 RepID=UPI001ADACCC2|nr:hypothetical protein [Sulfitobacter sp. R18_1]MBO9427949.1 hypothetical protein [Sulfitobacter sp. R18_1]